MTKWTKAMAQLHYRQYIHLTGNSLSIPTDLQKQFGHRNKNSYHALKRKKRLTAVSFFKKENKYEKI